jgi:FkbM family methyltransferase
MIGTLKTRTMFGRSVTLYSQPATAQDEWVIQATGGMQGGYFVEIGGFDGIRHSNTYALEKSFGWTGLLVDADPDLHEQARRNRPKCKHLCAAVAHYKGRSRFLRGGPWGGLEGLMPQGWKDEHRRRQTEVIFVNTTTLTEVFEAQNAPELIDYLSLDVEGAEVPILEEFFHAPGRRRFRCLTVEYLEDARTLMQLCQTLEPHGYILDQTRGWDACFRHSELTRPCVEHPVS